MSANKPIKVLWFNWKDKKNPLAGGAELINENIAERLVRDGHEVILLTAGFKGAVKEEIINGYKVIRLGNRWTVYWHAYRYYKKHLRGWADLVVDEMNTVPFFAKFYVKEKNILFAHQLCREIWFYEMFFPLNLIGYILEPVYLRLLSDRKVITVCESSKKDLMKYGFKEENIDIISEGIELEPVKNLGGIEKYGHPAVLSFGAVRAMKRTLHIVKAFELAKKEIPEIELIIAGDTNNKYAKKVLKYINRSEFSNSIKVLGRVNLEKKIELMQKTRLLCVTSVKEGWGLTVTEAASQGTPAIVYDVDALRDAVRHSETGLICRENSPVGLAENIIELIKDEEKYQNLRLNGWQWSKEINFEKSYSDFANAILDR